MTDDVRAAFKHKRETDQEFNERSAWNKRSKTEGPKTKIGLGTYHFGWALLFDWKEATGCVYL